MRHHIGHRDIAIVPNPGNHRQRKLCEVVSQIVIVKTQQIQSRTTTTNQYHHIKMCFIGINPIKRGNKRKGSTLRNLGRHKKVELHEAVGQTIWELEVVSKRCASRLSITS